MAKIGNLQSLSDLAKAASNRKYEGASNDTSSGKNNRAILTVSLDDVESKEQVRKQFNNIEDLAATMKVEGQQSPVIVYPKNEKGKYVIQKGERRWRALRVAGIDIVDIVVNDKEMSPLDEVAGELIENIQRDDLTPMEIAFALQKFISEGWKQVNIAKRLGKSAIFVSTHLSLLKLPKCVQNLYDDGICGDTETLNNLRLLFQVSESKCKAICSSALRDGITRKQSRDLLNDAKRVKEEIKATVNSESAETKSTKAPVADQGTENSSPSLSGTSTENSTNSTIDLGDSEDQIDLIESDSQTYKLVDPKKLVLSVNVLIDEDVKSGILLLDRVCREPSYIWVRVTEDNQERDVLVLASDVELLHMKG